MNAALRRLLRAAEWGASLALVAGCGSAESDSVASTDSGPADGATIDASKGTVPTEPYPVPFECDIGPVGTMDGFCCTHVSCIDAVSGTCPAPEDLAGPLPGAPAGSGTCACSPDITGPYAPHTAAEGACCYTFGIMACLGRPLLAYDQPRLAAIVRRSDWT